MVDKKNTPDHQSSTFVHDRCQEKNKHYADEEDEDITVMWRQERGTEFEDISVVISQENHPSEQTRFIQLKIILHL